jgi:hypothetical protein
MNMNSVVPRIGTLHTGPEIKCNFLETASTIVIEVQPFVGTISLNRTV